MVHLLNQRKRKKGYDHFLVLGAYIVGLHGNDAMQGHDFIVLVS